MFWKSALATYGKQCSRWLLIGFSLRLTIALWNGFFGPIFAADVDAASFHYWATELARDPLSYEISLGNKVYTTALGLFYYVTTDSLFLGSMMSCIAWLLSAVVLLRCFSIFSTETYLKSKLILVYALLPSSIIFTGITVREAYQLLFVNIAIYAILKIYYRRDSRQWTTLIMALTGAGSLHSGLSAFGIILFASALVFISSKKRRGGARWFKIGVAIAFVLMILRIGYSAIGDIFEGSVYSFDEGVDNSIRQYQENLAAVDARADYRTEAAISSLGGLITFVPIALLQYLFEPFPWHMSSISDGILMFENILRGWLLWHIIRAARTSTVPHGAAIRFVFFSYLILETIWSLGTANWGTAVRHHLPSFGLLILASYIAFAGNRLRFEVIK